MPVYMTLDENWEKVVAGLGALSDVGKGQLLYELANMQRQNIDARVRAGLGVDDAHYPPSKKTRNYGGTTLIGGSVSGRVRSAGNMMGAMQAQRVSEQESRIIFSSPAENAKALWANDGTRPHKITAKAKKALAFTGWEGPGAFNNVFRVSSKKMGARYFSMKNYSAPKGKRVAGFTVLHSVNHPGTPPRPFFGISPKDEVKLMEHAERYVVNAKRAVGL